MKKTKKKPKKLTNIEKLLRLTSGNPGAVPIYQSFRVYGDELPKADFHTKFEIRLRGVSHYVRTNEVISNARVQ